MTSLAGVTTYNYKSVQVRDEPNRLTGGRLRRDCCTCSCCVIRGASARSPRPWPPSPRRSQTATANTTIPEHCDNITRITSTRTRMYTYTYMYALDTSVRIRNNKNCEFLCSRRKNTSLELVQQTPNIEALLVNRKQQNILQFADVEICKQTNKLKLPPKFLKKISFFGQTRFTAVLMFQSRDL